MPDPNRLDSWKEIAHYLGRDIRTVHRWEADEGLPVHRQIHKKRGSVYAFKSELDEWRQGREGQEPRPRTIAAAPHSRRWRLLAATAAFGLVVSLVALDVGGVAGRLRPRASVGPLTDMDVVVLADFTNSTGDPVFDGTLREALAAQLEKSPFLKILPEDEVRDGVRLMGRDRHEPVVGQIAREVCERGRHKAVIGGTVTGVGTTYVITVQATDCQSGETLAREVTQAQDKEHVLGAVTAVASQLRARLGESLTSIQTLDRRDNLQVTTPSLEAFQAYALGRERDNETAWLPAITFYQRATELDPSFAMAYLLLGQKYGNLGEISRRREYYAKAFALIDRVSPRERFLISGLYYNNVTFESDRAAEIWQAQIRLYPRESSPHNYLGIYYMRRGEYQKGADQFQEAIRLDPWDAVFRGNLVWALISLNRYDDATAAAQKAFDQHSDGLSIHRRLLHLAFVEGNRAAADKEISRFAGTPQEYQSLNLQADDANARGRRREAREFTRRAVDIANRRNLPEAAAQLLMSSAEVDAMLGNCDAALSQARGLISREPDPGNAAGVARTLASCGETARAQDLVNEVSARFPEATFWNTTIGPTIRAAIELRRGHSAKALKLVSSAGDLVSIYVRGLAYLDLKQGAEAVAAFRDVLDHKSYYWGGDELGGVYGLLYAPSLVGAARAAALAGETAKARKTYRDFFDLWTDADADIPILRQARREYAAIP
jgi:tetratricopeptide (TPR) repeat protein